MKPNFAFAILLFLICNSAIAQDLIVKKNNDLIKCKIREIGLDEVKYNLSEYPADVLFSADKDDIAKIVFESGQEMEFKTAMTDPERYSDNRKNVLKIEFLSPLTGNTTFAWEKSLRPARSIESTIGIIGLGIDNDDRNAGGVFAKFGYKFIKDPDFYLRGMRYAHILKGSYIKPEIAFSTFRYDRYAWRDYYNNVSAEKERTGVVSGTVQLVLGKQWIIDNVFAVDIYAGTGYGFSTGDDYTTYQYGYSVMDESFPLAFSTGFKIGYLFK